MEFANITVNSNLIEYLPVMLFFIIAVGIIALALTLSYIIVPQKPYPEKLTVFECGFDPFDNVKKPFDVRFYLIAIMFLVFDLEVVFMYPWALSLISLSSIGYYSMLLFIGILAFGFIYEWKQGILKWD